jgi:GDP-4-dehydro-6-deoxy-D-mannose reductase
LALQKGKPGEVYNVCSGQDIRIGDILDRLCNLAKIPIRVEHDPERLRPSDVPVLRGSAARFQADTGWEPRIPFTQTLEDTLAYWRENISSTDGTT